ncbi:hypothetical protein [Streptomyces sp. NPDC000410]|uniref:hypothetical protein n=1 Tax=Streptomyces sp. NPDC000410 TaxID=3154254 RepID=UPI00331CFF26
MAGVCVGEGDGTLVADLLGGAEVHAGGREVGIGRPDDIEQLKAKITTLEQQVVDLELKLQDQGDELNAARTTNRELMAQLNRDPTRRH